MGDNSKQPNKVPPPWSHLFNAPKKPVKDVTRLPGPRQERSLAKTQSLRLPTRSAHSWLPKSREAIEILPNVSNKGELVTNPSDNLAKNLTNAEPERATRSVAKIPNIFRAMSFRPSSQVKHDMLKQIFKKQPLQLPEEEASLSKTDEKKRTVHRLQSTVSLKCRPTSVSPGDYYRNIEEKIHRKIQVFPSVVHQNKNLNTNSSMAIWNWLTQFRNILTARSSTDEYKIERIRSFYSQLADAAFLIGQIRHNFEYGLESSVEILDEQSIKKLMEDFSLRGEGEKGRKWIDVSSGIYMADNFKYLLKLQEKYNARMTLSSDTAVAKRRTAIVNWVITTAIQLKYPAETTHLSVYIIDAFVSTKGNKMTRSQWALLGVVALHIAAKLEEPNAVPVTRLTRLASSGNIADVIYPLDDVCRMEKMVLEHLQFDLYPPLAPLFAKLIIFGGSLNFPNTCIKKMVLDLSMGILLKSLYSYRLSAIEPIRKAQIALEIAVENVFFQLKLNSQREFPRYDVDTCQPGHLVEAFDFSMSYEIFTHRFITKRLPIIPHSTKLSPHCNNLSPVRDVKV